MATTVNPTKTRSAGSANGSTAGTSRAARPRVRGSVRDGSDASESREAQYDLLTAALLGLAIGAGTTLLLRRGPSGQRPLAPMWKGARTGARVAGRMAGRGARYAWDKGVDAWEHVPREEIAERVRDYFNSAREHIDEYVEHELKDLRKAIRRRRKRLGI